MSNANLKIPSVLFSMHRYINNLWLLLSAIRTSVLRVGRVVAAEAESGNRFGCSIRSPIGILHFTGRPCYGSRVVSSSYNPSKAILELGSQFYDVVKPAAFPRESLRYRNQAAAASVGLAELGEDEWREHFHAFKPLPDSLPECLALRYHGHQFRSYNDRLGDGRGFLFAQLFSRDGRLLDLGTKGSGQTPWSRGGDGRLTLKGAVREALATEMLESLCVNTSKTFSIYETGEELQRHDEPSPTRAAVLVRLGHSHIRFGSFQRHAALGDLDSLRALVDYCRRHFYPDAKDAAELLRQVTLKTARLCASWMTAGFVHGVLNTDNININGESFDYGPYRFLPAYDPEFTAAYFDETGLYAYGRQPEAVIWNLEQLATALLRIHPAREELVAALTTFSAEFNTVAAALVRERLGLKAGGGDDEDLLLATFNMLGSSGVGFEQFFFDWYGADRARAMRSPEAAKYAGDYFEKFAAIVSAWPAAKRATGDYFERAKPCTLLIDEIEAIWAPIASRDDWSLFDAKIEDIREMGRAYGRG